MVESIKELKKICQKSDNHNPEWYKLEKQWRFITLRVTWLLLRTSITANQVTIVMILLGFVSTILFSIGSYWYSLTGILALQLIYILDGVDGEIARYRKSQSTEGVFLDLIMHLASVSLPLAGIAIGLFRKNPGIDIMLLGLAVGMFSAFEMDIQALKHHAVFMKLVRIAKESKGMTKSVKIEQKIEGLKEDSKLKNVFRRYINPFYENYLLMQVVTIAAIFDGFYWVLLFYGISFPVIWFVKLVHEYKIGTKDYDFLFRSYKK